MDESQKSSTEVLYRIAVNGADLGPYTAEQVHSMVSNGQISPETPVWTEGMSEWVAYWQVFASSAPGNVAQDTQTDQTSPEDETHANMTDDRTLAENPQPYTNRSGEKMQDRKDAHISRHRKKFSKTPVIIGICAIILAVCIGMATMLTGTDDEEDEDEGSSYAITAEQAGQLRAQAAHTYKPSANAQFASMEELSRIDRRDRVFAGYDQQFNANSDNVAEADMGVARAENALARAKAEGDQERVGFLQQYVNWRKSQVAEQLKLTRMGVNMGSGTSREELAMYELQNLNDLLSGVSDRDLVAGKGEGLRGLLFNNFVVRYMLKDIANLVQLLRVNTICGELEYDDIRKDFLSAHGIPRSIIGGLFAAVLSVLQLMLIVMAGRYVARRVRAAKTEQTADGAGSEQGNANLAKYIEQIKTDVQQRRLFWIIFLILFLIGIIITVCCGLRGRGIGGIGVICYVVATLIWPKLEKIQREYKLKRAEEAARKAELQKKEAEKRAHEEEEKRRKMLCPRCGGSGQGEGGQLCEKCGGSGVRRVEMCPVCAGKGVNAAGCACPRCGGEGQYFVD